jgi:hypothetical protein
MHLVVRFKVDLYICKAKRIYKSKPAITRSIPFGAASIRGFFLFFVGNRARAHGYVDKHR